MEGLRDIALIRNKKEDVKMNIPCSQKPRVLSKPRSMERGAKFNPGILELHSVIFLLEKHLIFPHGTEHLKYRTPPRWPESLFYE